MRPDITRNETSTTDTATADTLRINAVTAGFATIGDERRNARIPVLDVDSVRKVYPSVPPVEALRGVSFTVEEGELVAIVGPSGSGKTTLLHLMGTLDRPTSGAIRITGLDAAQMSDRELSALRGTRIGFVFQQFFLADHESARDNVADGLLYAGVGLDERRERANVSLAQVGLAHRGSARPNQLSGGERQRVAIARALAGRPTIVLADEPTGNLDSVNSQAILSLLEELNEQGATILVITHEREIAERLPRQIEMLDGRIVADTVREVASRSATDVVTPSPDKGRMPWQ
jgi:putative ABC transport system ATP-binding protein